jgi:hypothetical protein
MKDKKIGFTNESYKLFSSQRLESAVIAPKTIMSITLSKQIQIK